MLSYSSWPCGTCAATPSIAPRAPQCKSRAHYPCRELTENFAWKRLDSRSVDQPKMCHAQIKESCAYYESETQPECRHRGSRSSRRGDPHPHLSSHSRPNQLLPWAATCLRRSSGTGKAEQRKPPRLSSSRDRLRGRLRSTTPLAMKELLKTNVVQQERDAQRYLWTYVFPSGGRNKRHEESLR